MIRRVFALVSGASVAVLLSSSWVDHSVIGNVLASLIALLAWSFAGLYALRSNWRATVPGRALLYVMTTLAAFATQVSISAWTESSYPYRDQVRGVLYWALALTVANMVWTLYRIQRER